MRNILIWSSYIFITWVLCSCSSYPEAEQLLVAKKDSLPEIVDYNLHVRPILSDKCFNCHGPDKNKQEGGLALHLFDRATQEIKGHQAISPGNLAKSEAIKRILTEDSELKMPLSGSNLSLTDLEKATLIKWVQQGAKYKPHWAFIKPELPAIPEVKNKKWIINPIDNFILSKLEKEKVTPSQKADKEKLARRVCIDITGLPPTIDQLDAFLKDNSTRAYSNFVDKLLQSPHYGERLANEWLDVARYADSHGYQDDGESEMWPWRDWVIGAFNKNLPYDKFITWQLAGDLLPKASKEQVLATGFNRNHMINAEGGIIEEEYRTEYVIDRVGATTKAFLALTVECARCHDHKYDPISQKEFYQLSSFFNQLDEPGKGNLYENSTGPTMLLTDTKTDQELLAIRNRMTDLGNKIYHLQKSSHTNITTAKQTWLASKTVQSEFDKHLVGYYSFDNSNPKDSILKNIKNDKYNGKLSKGTSLTAGVIGKALEIDGEEKANFGDSKYNFERHEPFSYSLWVNVPKKSEKGYSILGNCATTYHGNRGYEMLLINEKIHVRITSAWPSNALEVVSSTAVPIKKWTQIGFSYDGSSKAEGIGVYINGKKIKTTITYNDLYRTIVTRGLDKERAILDSLQKIEKKKPLNLEGTQLKRRLSLSAFYTKPHNFCIGSRVDAGVPSFFDGKIDEVKVYDKKLSDLEMMAVFANKPINDNALITATGNDVFYETYNSYFQNTLIKAQDSLLKLRAKENEYILPLQEIKVMKERKKWRETFILNRGNYDAPTTKVQPSSIAAVMPYTDKYPKSRLGLAQWITDPDNPIVARVAVNRYWQMIFGNGLVASSSDFGNQGNLPTNLALLDWLAIEFVKSGWDVKALLRLIVNSQTYQQSSKMTADKMAFDSQNMYLSRSPRYRYNYEIIRDNMLVASGLIHQKIGGPSFKPYQKEGLWEEKTNSPVNNYYKEDEAPEIYRRSMYIFLKRTSPHPAFNTFDGADRFTCQIKRQNTNTPLQALTARNDPQFVEAARVLAQHTLEDFPESNIEKGIALAFRKTLSRNPNKQELAVLTKVYNYEKSKFLKEPLKANKIIATGKYLPNKSLDAVAVASMTIVCQTIFNLDETISRE